MIIMFGGQVSEQGDLEFDTCCLNKLDNLQFGLEYLR